MPVWKLAGRSRKVSKDALHRLPAWVFGIAAIVAFPYLIYAGRTQWFYVDDFDFFSDRRLTSFSNLMQAHAGHWSTLPIIEYRVLYKVVGLNHYWPYLVPVVLAHITAAILLYLVMGRAKVHPWIATTAGVLFLFIGAGWADILWSFQIGFTGALALGLGSLLLVDHSGTDQRRECPRRRMWIGCFVVFGRRRGDGCLRWCGNPCATRMEGGPGLCRTTGSALRHLVRLLRRIPDVADGEAVWTIPVGNRLQPL